MKLVVIIVYSLINFVCWVELVNADDDLSIKGVGASTVDVVKKQQDIYPASFFANYLPQNSLEMIERLPGFNFDQGSNARGFGGNAGNVLIDGVRPTSKSGGLRSALARIPAAQVDRIEILKGGVSAGEASGQSIVANVIKKEFGSSGTWTAKLRRVPAGEIKPSIEAAISTTLGEWKTSFDLDFGGNPGYRNAVIENRNSDDTLTASSNEIFTDRAKWLFVNGEGGRDFIQGRMTLNARIGGDRWNSDSEREIFETRLPDDLIGDQNWRLDEINELNLGELGIDWVRTTDGWKWHLIGLGLIEDKHYENQFDFEDRLNADGSTSSFSQDAEKSEFITRATYGNVGALKFKPEYGIEFAKNKLDSGLVFVQDGEDVALDGANVIVEEFRSELFANFVYKMNDTISFKGGATGEFSKIKVIGNAPQEQTFKFIKPQLSTTYKVDKQRMFTIDLERKVGQLDFNDFAASSQAADDRTTSGNPDLAPDISDELSFSFDWSFSQRGSFKIKLFHEWKKDILEQIILPSGGQGLGNAGDARFYGVITDINLPLDWILPQGLIEISHSYRRSTFDDPLINQERTINGYTPNWLNFKLRQDIAEQKLAWGIEYFGNFIDTNYFVDEIQTFEGNKRFKLFIETSRFFGVKTKLEVSHLNTGDYTRSRFFYSPNRGGQYEGSEIAYRHRRPEVTLSISGTF